MPVYGLEFIGPMPTGAIQRTEDGGVFMVLHEPAPDGWWVLTHGLPLKEDPA
jgi:hypothetical protein